MLAPHELKNKTFGKAVRGYNPNEVDDYIDFLIEKYTELYRENDELERKLKIVVTNLDEIRDEEESAPRLSRLSSLAKRSSARQTKKRMPSPIP